MRQNNNEKLEQRIEEVDTCHRDSEGNLQLDSASLSKIDPALKIWLDDVIVPAMVRLYLAGKK
jgi:hypothetical protein